MEELLKTLIEPLVGDINKVRIEKEGSDQEIRFNIFVPKEDIAKVIGKEGKMIKSIKNLLKVRAIKEKVYVSCEVNEA